MRWNESCERYDVCRPLRLYRDCVEMQPCIPRYGWMALAYAINFLCNPNRFPQYHRTLFCFCIYRTTVYTESHKMCHFLTTTILEDLKNSFYSARASGNRDEYSTGELHNVRLCQLASPRGGGYGLSWGGQRDQRSRGEATVGSGAEKYDINFALRITFVNAYGPFYSSSAYIISHHLRNWTNSHNK